MPILQSRTREQIRLDIGQALGIVYPSSLSSIGAADGSTIVDNTLRGGTDNHVGKWIIITSGARDGDISRCSAYTAATGTVTIAPVFTTQIASGVTYEMWDEEFAPARIHNLINQAISQATGKAFDPEEDISLHLHPYIYRYDIPAVFAAINKLEYRRSFQFVIVNQAEANWTEIAAPAGVTRAIDTQDKREGNSSLKVTITAAVAAATTLVSVAITSLDISGYDYIEMWVKSSVATALGDLRLLLDDTAAVASALENLQIPALVADTWTFVRLLLDTPELDTAIISVGLRYEIDIGAATVWVDDIRAVRDSSAQWETIPQRQWQIDKEATDLILKVQPPYSLLKISGGDEPVLLNADATASEIDPDYIVAKVCGLAMLAASGGPITDPDQRRALAGQWLGEADRRLLAMPNLQGYRSVT